MTLDELNRTDTAVAHKALLQCCGSERWAQAVLAQRPFRDHDGLLSTAESVWWALHPDDWLQAFSAHPKIGERKLSNWSSQEQNGLASAATQLLEQLARGNQEYEQKFGWIFLVNATGKGAHKMLESLEARLKNNPSEELRIAAREQAGIMRLRLNKLLNK